MKIVTLSQRQDYKTRRRVLEERRTDLMGRDPLDKIILLLGLIIVLMILLKV